ncbi:PREDICTED: coiled-coil domain-containing protein 22 isoform X2 [Cyprinodon variegatus]|uniref:coiled-coil domain-containing protein 22 isoform X2 n=1 Tax=Cyprinodon variegatus TaxID=28743 RepID=UPI0007429BA1|nr:PREDICTED: coiled-coil domain-containing protein 22 isoform X2 [Cyprinodon variegatus]
MEEVDKILIHALRQVGTEVGENIERVGQFTSELIVEAVVRCIRVIDPGPGGVLPTTLPPGMSARFRVGMSLAQACQDIGYKGEIGYQTFLYSNEPEIRSLLMFLVEKLPRESSEASDQPTGKSAVLHRAIATVIKAQLAVSWVPLNCRLPLHGETQSRAASQKFSVHPLSLPYCNEGQKSLKEVKEYKRDILLPATAQSPSQTSMVSSMLEQHMADLSSTQEWDTEWKSQGLLYRLAPQEYRSRKLKRLRNRIKEQLRSVAMQSPESIYSVCRPSSELSDLLRAFRGPAPFDLILTKGTHFTHTQKFTFTEEATAVKSQVHSGRHSEGDTQLHQQEELALLQQQFQQLCSDIDQIAADMRHRSVTSTQVFDELKQRELENAKNQEDMQVKKTTLELLPDADNNLQKLQSQVETGASRVVNLASQWEKHRAPLIEELRRLKQICSSKDLESSTKLSEIKHLHEKICMATEDAKKKEESYKQLGKHFQFRVLPFDLSLSLHVFKRSMAAALCPLQANGLKILPYLDDWLICAPTETQATAGFTGLTWPPFTQWRESYPGAHRLPSEVGMFSGCLFSVCDSS